MIFDEVGYLIALEGVPSSNSASLRSKAVDRIFRQSSVSFPPLAGAKYRQGIQYGTDERHEMYATARNTIEGFNGFVKDGAHEALADPTRRRLHGKGGAASPDCLIGHGGQRSQDSRFHGGSRGNSKREAAKGTASSKSQA